MAEAATTSAPLTSAQRALLVHLARGNEIYWWAPTNPNSKNRSRWVVGGLRYVLRATVQPLIDRGLIEFTPEGSTLRVDRHRLTHDGAIAAAQEVDRA